MVVGISMVIAAPAAPAAPAMNLLNAGDLPQNMQMHGTALIGDRMYVFGGDLAGGASTLWSNKVQSAKVDVSTFKLGPWREEQSMPDMRSYMTNAIETVNDRIYILGGVVATAPTEEKTTKRVKSVTWTRVKPDGTLEAWHKSQDFPGEAVLMTASCSTDKNLLLIGGLAVEGTDQVLACDLSPDGEPVNWRVVGRLPMPLYNHGASFQNGRIYVWGGQTAISSANARVLSASFSDGKLGEWRDEEPMSEPISAAACCGINDYLVSIGGWMGQANPVKDIWFAHIGPGGRVSQWQQVTTDVKPTIYHSLGLLKDNGCVFVTGGQAKPSRAARGKILNSVQAFKIPSPSKAVQVAAGWPSMDAALAKAKAENKNALVFFHSPSVPASARIWNETIGKPEFQSIAGNRVVLGAVDTSKDTEWCYKLGVFRVPCIVEVSADGKAVKKSGILNDANDVRQFLSGSN